jgi:hypothetical protein
LILNKYGLDGVPLWTRTIGNTSEDINGLSVASDGIYLTGGNVMGGILQKYDKTGSQVWAEQFGSTRSPSDGRGTSATSTGVYVAGDLVANQTANGYVVFVREYDFIGNVVWSEDLTNASGLNEGIVRSVYAASSGVYVVGSVRGSLKGSTSIGIDDAFLVKYDLKGSLAWIRQFGTPQSDTTAYDVSGDSTGVYVSGATTPSASGFLRKYDFNGNQIWADLIESPDSSEVGGSSLAVDASGVYVSVATPRDREFILKYDPNGARLWSFQMQSSAYFINNVAGYHLAPGPAGPYVAGSLSEGRAGLVAEVSSSPSLVFFGINPPISFVLVGVLVTAGVTSIFFFRRLRRGRMRPTQLEPSARSFPVRD